MNRDELYAVVAEARVDRWGYRETLDPCQQARMVAEFTADPNLRADVGEARRTGEAMIGRYGIVRYTVHKRQHRRWVDGTDWSGPWTAADQGGEDGDACPR